MNRRLLERGPLIHLKGKRMMTLQEFFIENPVCAAAFSGGVDSAVLLYCALRYGQRAAAYYVKTPFQPDFELEDAKETARRLGASLTVLEFNILSVPQAAANPPDRCYHCKRALFTRILRAARDDGFSLVLDGSNASDDVADRPGMRALQELGVRSPLRECGLTKSAVRRLAREAGLPVWDKPSYACLATRVPTGIPITAGALARVARGEALLMERGLFDFRLRMREEGFLLQVREEQTSLARRLLPEVQRELSAAVGLDPAPRAPRET